MSQTWKHPELGTFNYDDECGRWIGTHDLPAFKIFKWKNKSTEPTGAYELAFESDDRKEPSAGAIALAATVISNHEKLASLITPTLWEEFNGHGSSSGMWWHGDMDEVAANFGYDDRPSPKCPDDLLPVMRFAGITIHETVYECDGPLAEFTFAAVFEEEHGVGILTDGNTIIGTGYANDALPFDSA